MAHARLTPSVAADRLYPANAAYMARTDLQQTRMLGFLPSNLDSVTTLLLGLLNGRPTIRHRCAVTDESLALLERAGLHVDERMHVYENGDDAERHADALIAQGYKLLSPYPLGAGRFPDSAHLVTPDTYNRLNAKAHLGDLAPAENMAPRTLHAIDALAAQAFDHPVFVKSGGEAATGLGYAVRHCVDQAQWQSAIAWFRSLGDVHSVIVEDDVPVVTCWCAGIVVEADQTHHAGAAEQLFSSPAHQAGSVIDAANPFPAEGAALAITIGEAARKRGFVGIAGLDIGMTPDGRFIVFDPNFRFNASSSQVLLHDSAARCGGFRASRSAFIATAAPFAEMAAKLVGPIDDGWLVPARLLNGALLPSSDGRSSCTGFVMGADRAEAFARHDALQRMFAG